MRGDYTSDSDSGHQWSTMPLRPLYGIVSHSSRMAGLSCNNVIKAHQMPPHRHQLEQQLTLSVSSLLSVGQSVDAAAAAAIAVVVSKAFRLLLLLPFHTTRVASDNK